jgi:hypothetical protein
VPAATAREHARTMAGSYTNSRGGFTNFLRILDFMGQVKMGVGEKGELVAPAVTGTAAQPRKWVEIAPFVWRDVNSNERIAAKVENGRVVRWSFDTISPFMMFDRTPWYRDSSWLLPVLLAAIGIILLTGVAWPSGALSRRRYKAAHPLEGRPLQAQRLTYLFCWLALLALILWATFITIGFNSLTLLSGPLDWLLYLTQFLSLVAFIGLAVLALWNAWLKWKTRRGWFARIWSILLVIGALTLLWVALAFHLIGFGTHY